MSKMKSPTNQRRTQRGSILALFGTGVAVLVVGALGLFSAEVTRLTLAGQQLTAVCDAAALAGAQAMVAYNPSDNNFTSSSYIEATKSAALNAVTTSFRGGSIVGIGLSDAEVSTGADLQVEDNKGEAKVEFVARNGGGLAVKVTGSFGLTPMTGKFLPICTTSASACSAASLPKIDMMLGMTLNGALDDFTNVQPMIWVPSSGSEAYEGSSSTSMVYHHGNTYAIACEGMPEDWAPAPQEKSGTIGREVTEETPGDPGEAATYQWYTIGSYGPLNKIVCGANDQAGNPTHPANAFFPQMLDTFDGMTFNTKLYQCQQAGAPESYTGSISGTDYTTMIVFDQNGREVLDESGHGDTVTILAALHPFNEVKLAAINLCNIFQSNSDPHFGMVSFESRAGQSADDLITDYHYNTQLAMRMQSPADPATFPIPTLAMSSSDENYDLMMKWLQPPQSGQPYIVPLGEHSNISDAIKTADTQIKQNGRPAARRVLVLLTAGMADSEQDAIDAATSAGRDGIAIFPVGLALRGEQDKMKDQLNKIASAAGHGSTAYVIQCSDASQYAQITQQVTQVYENIARNLVTQTQLAQLQ